MRIVRPPLASAVLGLLLAATLPAAAATFTVNATADAVDAVPGDGACATAAATCTLRAGVMEANALPGADVVALPAGTFRLMPTGSGEDLGLTREVARERVPARSLQRHPCRPIAESSADDRPHPLHPKQARQGPR